MDELCRSRGRYCGVSRLHDREGYVQLEEGVRNLQHEHMRVVMLMAHKNTLAGPSHAILLIVFFEAFQAGQDGGIFLGLRFLGPESIV